MDFEQGMRLTEDALGAVDIDVCVLRDLATSLDLGPPTTTEQVRRFVRVVVSYYDRLSTAVPSAGDRFRDAAADFEAEAELAGYAPSFVESSRLMNNSEIGSAHLAAIAFCPVHDLPQADSCA